MSQTLHKAGLQRGARRRHDDRNDSRSTKRRSDRRREVGDNDVDAATDQLVRQLLGAFAAPASIMEFDDDVLAFRIAEQRNPRQNASANGCGGDADTKTPMSGSFRVC